MHETSLNEILILICIYVDICMAVVFAERVEFNEHYFRLEFTFFIQTEKEIFANKLDFYWTYRVPYCAFKISHK